MQTTLPTYRPHPTAHRSAADFLVIWFVVAGLSILAAVAGWQFWHTDRIFTGVRVADVSVGGMTRAAALLHLSRELRNYPIAPLQIEWEDRTWALSSSQLLPQPDLLAGASHRSGGAAPPLPAAACSAATDASSSRRSPFVSAGEGDRWHRFPPILPISIAKA